MRRLLIFAALLGLAGCAPDSEEALSLCREDAANVADVAATDVEARTNRYIEHCMRTFGYVWDHANSDCGDYADFRAGAPLSDDPAAAGACFRSGVEERRRLIDRLADWLN